MEHIYFEAQVCSPITTLKEANQKRAKEQTINVWWVEMIHIKLIHMIVYCIHIPLVNVIFATYLKRLAPFH